MAKILQIETSATTCATAVSFDGVTVAQTMSEEKNAHASRLTGFISDVMAAAGITYRDLDAVAVSKGPGSYTGLRIGVSTAKGICFAADKPLLAIGTLDMMAKGFLSSQPGFKGLVCPMIDARRMEVYTALYTAGLSEVLPVHARIIVPGDFNDLLERQTIAFIGDGAMKCIENIKHSNAIFIEENFNNAANMSSLAAEKFAAKEFEDVAYFEPFYLKDFVATQPKKLI